jgi:hypothetical protein
MRVEERESKGRETKLREKAREEAGCRIFCHSCGAPRESNGEQTSMYAIKLRERRGGTWIF